ncbi:MAG TPA: cysteine synthase family protein [Candidatus Polarisedimenticolia bacterium]|nr:cysteine synthase family protein [Candidatus Polarisedimenticolia bacterium]
MKNLLSSIGRTPLIRLERLPGTGSAEIFVKYEGANPTGSMKDRMALSMVEGAERRGQLRPRGKVVEYTGGSTGSSLAMVCAVKGYRGHFVSSDAFAEEKLQTMRAFGSEVEVIPSVNGKVTAELIQAIIERARELAEEPDAFWTDQFNNADNRQAYHAMAEEILTALDGRVDAFVMGVGTGGCFSGNAEMLKRKAPGVRCVAFEPAVSRALSGMKPTGGHRLEGTGPGFVPSICRLDLADEIVPVTDADAYETARRMAREEGIFGGITSGANVWVALRQAQKLGPGKRVVTVVCDSGLKYLQGDLYR